jgi:hypothetical protein
MCGLHGIPSLARIVPSIGTVFWPHERRCRSRSGAFLCITAASARGRDSSLRASATKWAPPCAQSGPLRITVGRDSFPATSAPGLTGLAHPSAVRARLTVRRAATAHRQVASLRAVREWPRGRARLLRFGLCLAVQCDRSYAPPSRAMCRDLMGSPRWHSLHARIRHACAAARLTGGTT